jgi:hypothetical protein
MRAWAATFREYRGLETDDPLEPEAQSLRQELVNLNWARNKYYDKEQLLDPESTYQRRYGDIWHQLRLDFEILELASRAPVTAADVERRLAESIRKVHTSAPYVLEKLCEKEFLEKRTVDGDKAFVARFPAEELLEIAIRDFGERMLGAEIELSDVELVKLQRVVESAGMDTEDGEN